MEGSTKEIEVKLPFDSVEAARSSLERLGARLARPRRFEDNAVFDREHDPLKPAGRLLRLRREGDRALLTFKDRAEQGRRHKVCEEYETTVGNADATLRLLQALGFTSRYRYQKHRTLYELDDLSICLDETPLGCFVELEGPPDQIDRVAGRLGFHEEQFVCETYRVLHDRAIERGELPAGDLLVEGRET